MVLAYAMAVLGVVFMVLGDLGHFFRLHIHMHTPGLGDPAHQLSFTGSALVLVAALLGLWKSRPDHRLSLPSAVFAGGLAAGMLVLGFLGFSVRPHEDAHHLLHLGIGAVASCTLVWGSDRVAKVLAAGLGALYTALLVAGVAWGGVATAMPLDLQSNAVHGALALIAGGFLVREHVRGSLWARRSTGHPMEDNRND